MAVFLKLYGIAFIVFFAIDLLWLGVVAKNLYNQYLGHLLKSNVNWIAAIIFYLIFIGGLVFFAIMPAVDKGLWTQALLLGALFGFITYATYDLTNLATLKDWPIFITIIDLIWGTTLGAVVSVFTYLIYMGVFN
ncbi:DUF2177 family protein [Liberiplasma polymorphum]|uniref:DUF2177 family protein n=1 Tax=Liberiplasma polymorphum TaxID=3374570 RepID=UPI003775EB15